MDRFRIKALEKLLPMQKGDFIGIFKAMKGLPCTIRLLDPPLHEFVPQTPEDIEDIHILVMAAAEKKAADFVWHNRVGAALPLPSTLVRQILLNLLLNAVQAIAVGGRVECDTHVRGIVPDYQYIVMVVGIGTAVGSVGQHISIAKTLGI